MQNLVKLHNKMPAWNEETQSYVLNFHGRVTQASVKNFQIILDDDREWRACDKDAISRARLRPAPS